MFQERITRNGSFLCSSVFFQFDDEFTVCSWKDERDFSLVEWNTFSLSNLSAVIACARLPAHYRGRSSGNRLIPRRRNDPSGLHDERQILISPGMEHAVFAFNYRDLRKPHRSSPSSFSS